MQLQPRLNDEYMYIFSQDSFCLNEGFLVPMELQPVSNAYLQPVFTTQMVAVLARSTNPGLIKNRFEGIISYDISEGLYVLFFSDLCSMFAAAILLT